MSERLTEAGKVTGRSGGGADNVPLAILVIVLAVLALSLGDALVKGVSDAFSLWQIFVLRSLLACPVLIAIVAARARGPLSHSLLPTRFGWAALRSLMLVLMWIAYYAALPYVPFSIAAAAYYTLPLFITLFAALFLGEPVGRRGWLAVALGFAGVLLILKPSTDSFNAYAVLPLAAAVLYAGAMVLTRSKCRNETALGLSLALHVAFLVVGLLASGLAWLLPTATATADEFLLGAWAAMGALEWTAMCGLAVAAIIGSVGGAYAYQKAPASVVASFDFTYLAFAALWGLVLFGEVPDGVAGAGILLIATGGLLAIRR